MLFFKKLSLSLFIFLFSLNSFAQAQGGGEGIDDLVNDTKSDLLVVVGGGLAGAILGLSTLSFVEEPKEHTRNIIVGASIGIIAGVAFVAFSQANKTQTMLYSDGEAAYESSDKFNTYARLSWHDENISDYHHTIVSPYQLGMNLKF